MKHAVEADTRLILAQIELRHLIGQGEPNMTPADRFNVLRASWLSVECASLVLGLDLQTIIDTVREHGLEFESFDPGERIADGVTKLKAAVKYLPAETVKWVVRHNNSPEIDSIHKYMWQLATTI
jgi:hypothetical protein